MRLLLALLLLAALSGCGADDDPTVAADPSGASASPAASAASPSASPSRAATATRSPAPTPEQAVSTVRDLLGAFGDETPRAWELLTERSQASFGSRAAFDDFGSEYAEGLGAFGDLPATTARLGADAAVVVLAGEVSREGDTDTDAAALPVRVEGGAWRVELLSPTVPGRVEIDAPQPGAVVTSRSEVRAYVPAAARTQVLLDGAAQEFTATPSDGDRTEVSLSVALPAGRHQLLVAATRADGFLLAEAVPFSVR